MNDFLSVFWMFFTGVSFSCFSFIVYLALRELNKKSDSITVFVDKRTGVCYVVSSRGGVTPMFNADGSLRVDECAEGGQ